MLRELTKEDWVRILGIPESHVPGALLVWGTRGLKSRYAAMRGEFGDVFEVGGPNGIFQDVLIGYLGEACVGYASVYGAAMVSEIVHLFGVLGARVVIQVGTCGGLVDNLKPGDLFAARQAYCGEGASQYYGGGDRMVGATVSFAGSGDSGTARIGEGRIYTTSALLAEGTAEVEKWAREGFAAVDMETAATFAVAEYFGMDRGSLLTVFDNPGGQEHILTSDPEKDARRVAAQEAMVEIAVATIAECLKSGGGAERQG
jgi:uridine phosphorylase